MSENSTREGDDAAKNEGSLWHVVIDGESKRLTLEQLDHLFQIGIIDGENLIWQEGMEAWKPLRVVAGLGPPPIPMSGRSAAEPPANLPVRHVPVYPTDPENAVLKPDVLPLALPLAGVVVGGYLGFLSRPSLMLFGQLPFETVILRGSNLRGMDQMLVSAAETSFNHLVLGAVVGAVLGGIAATMTQKRG